jgi:hypothetical protein
MEALKADTSNTPRTYARRVLLECFGRAPRIQHGRRIRSRRKLASNRPKGWFGGPYGVQIDEWTDELLAEAAVAKETFDVFQKDRMTITDIRRSQYPTLG